MNKFIRDAITDYDNQVDPAAVHRVVHGYLKNGTETRASLEIKVQMNWQISRNRDLYLKTQGHASSLLCIRRNEGDHRSIKMEARLTPNISGPLLSVRLRKE